AVAAAVIGIAGVGGYSALMAGGGGTVAGTESAKDGSAADTREAPSVAEAPDKEDRLSGEAAGRERGYPVPVSASGTDYTRENLSGVRGQRDAGAADAPVQAPPGLERLAAPSALRTCLEAVGTTYPGQVTMVDYARFEAEPALVIAITPRDGGSQVVVVGPGCTRGEIDEKYHATV
ncbi:MAG: hypothetical protein ACRDT6_17135, partial [Micromonosporaceae bacterium]